MATHTSEHEGTPSLPLFGLGTHCIKGELATRVVLEALRIGYRLIDTASVYKNESEIGKAIQLATTTQEDKSQRKSDDDKMYSAVSPGSPLVSRTDLFITTKLSPKEQTGYDACIQSCMASMQRLGLDYLDCFMLHWPATGGLQPDDPKQIPLRQECWRAMEDLQKKGLVRFLGVSNFLPRHIETLSSLPYVNQLELHPWCRQEETVAYCRKAGIKIQAYSPIARGDAELLSHPALKECILASYPPTKNASSVKTDDDDVNVTVTVQQINKMKQNEKEGDNHDGHDKSSGGSWTPVQAVLMTGFAQGYDSIVSRSTQSSHLQQNWEASQWWQTQMSNKNTPSTSVACDVLTKTNKDGQPPPLPSPIQVFSVLSDEMRGVPPKEDQHFCWFSEHVK